MYRSGRPFGKRNLLRIRRAFAGSLFSGHVQEAKPPPSIPRTSPVYEHIKQGSCPAMPWRTLAFGRPIPIESK